MHSTSVLFFLSAVCFSLVTAPAATTPPLNLTLPLIRAIPCNGTVCLTGALSVLSANPSAMVATCVNQPLSNSQPSVVAAGLLNGLDYTIAAAPAGQYGFIFNYTGNVTNATSPTGVSNKYNTAMVYQAIGMFLDNYTLSVPGNTAAANQLLSVSQIQAPSGNSQFCGFGSQSITSSVGSVAASGLLSANGGQYGANTVGPQGLSYNFTINLVKSIVCPTTPCTGGTVTMNMIAAIPPNVSYTLTGTTLTTNGISTLAQSFDNFVTELNSGENNIIGMTLTSTFNANPSVAVKNLFGANYNYVGLSFSFLTGNSWSFLWDPNGTQTATTISTSQVSGTVNTAPVGGAVNTAPVGGAVNTAPIGGAGKL